MRVQSVSRIVFMACALVSIDAFVSNRTAEAVIIDLAMPSAPAPTHWKNEMWLGDFIDITLVNTYTDPIQSVKWEQKLSADSCTGTWITIPNASGLTFLAGSGQAGVSTIKATVTYAPFSGSPVPHAPTEHEKSITWKPANNFKIVGCDPANQIQFYGGNLFIKIYLQLQQDNDDCGGAPYLNVLEKITYIKPDTWLPEFDGQWGPRPIDITEENRKRILGFGNGVITDDKALNAPIAAQDVNQTELEYNQRIGIVYTDFCGVQHVKDIGGLHVKMTRVTNGAPGTWKLDINKL